MISRYFAYNKKVSVIYANNTKLLEDIMKLKKMPESFSELIGKFYTACGMMAFSDIKEESDELITQINGGGDSGILYSASKLKDGNVIIKGFIENKNIDFSKYNNIADIIGKDGNITIIKNNIYTRLGYKGITPLISGNIVDDFRNYYENSTQKPAFIGIEVFKQEKVIRCIGYLITFMPDATDNEISNIQSSLNKNMSLENLVKNNKNDDEIVKEITADSNIEKLESSEIIYNCDCNKDKYIDMFYTLKKSELEEILGNEEKINIVCQYCNKSYDFSREEIENIIKDL